MTGIIKNINKPLVSVLISTYNRPKYVPEALDSILKQTYQNFEIILVRDGGLPVRDIISSFNDPRLTFIDRDQNHGLSYSFNEALSVAKGEYVCYLGDDDIFYPHHIETLMNEMLSQDECEVVYGDLYRTNCSIMADGTRKVLSKNIEVSREYDRAFMFQMNHVLAVSMLHTRSLLDRTGPFNEDVKVMIDWDIHRRMAFFTDFKKTNVITGEYFAPVSNSDRISIVQRKNTDKYMENVMTIRTSRPKKPWSKIADTSIVFVPKVINEEMVLNFQKIWAFTFLPYKVFVPLTPEEKNGLSVDFSNLEVVDVPSGSGYEARLDAALARVDGEFTAVVPSDMASSGLLWLEKSLWPMMNCNDKKQAIELVDSTSRTFSAVFFTDKLRSIRSQFGHMSFEDSIMAADVHVRQPLVEEYPLQFDNMLTIAKLKEKGGRFLEASGLYGRIALDYGNELRMHSYQARALHMAGKSESALDIILDINSQRPTANTLILEGKIRKTLNDHENAIKVLNKARSIIEKRELVWN